MTDDSALRREIKRFLDRARGRIADFTGLYADEDLTRDVLRACHEVAAGRAGDERLEEARLAVETRCESLVRAADRFGVRDLAAIAAARARAIAAVDAFQDAVIETRRAEGAARVPRSPLKKKAL